VAERLENLVKRVGVVIGERRRLALAEKRLITALNRALRRMGYQVVAAEGRAPRRRRRIAGRRRARRRTGARRTRGRAK
jgi:hypothetical protein